MTDSAPVNRSMPKDLGILFLTAWIAGVAAMLGRGLIAPVQGLGFGLPLFALGAVIIFAKRRSDERLKSALLTVIILGLLAGYGMYYGATRT
ncbi:hypothetical protein K3M67_04755 [Sphingobium sp. V4]|uniref:hypothetical protein n=1 Tax=Sphingobium sp. V4 TaxID=3038927 RepID=UPI0025582D45|nr:hypothetical protein [Sphingobium sp. V4]WIW89289.1 hypothetical protein K3M67_04755 [Sphingobium sp. V4]